MLFVDALEGLAQLVNGGMWLWEVLGSCLNGDPKWVCE